MVVHRRQFLSGAGAALAATPQLGGDWDVVVAGGGPAGMGAALGAARAGAKTLLLENHPFVGGVGAWALGMTINQMLPEGRSRGAVHDAIVDRLKAHGDEALIVRDHALVCNVEYLKVVLMDALDAAGVKYLLHARVADAMVERNRVAGVVVASKQGMRKIRARAVVDATGDGDVAFYAGAETMKGRETDGFLSPMTLNIIVTNVDVPAAIEAMGGGGSKRLLDQARSKYPLLPETMGPAAFPLKNAVTINHAGTKLRGSLDATSLEEITEAERYSRRQAIQMVQALREFGGPAFARAQLANTAAQIGVRETRRVKGLYLLTEEDAKNGTRFDDAIAWRSGFLDIGYVRYERMKVHDVPYRAILPAKVDGLLMSGRCISATHVGAAAGKSMGNCMATGHAAGIAAAFSAARKKTPRELKAADIQAQLAKDGVDLKRHPNQENLKA
jgi:hypothetical protein